MELGIETILWTRLFVLKNTESQKVYNRERRETVELIEKLKTGEIQHFTRGGFVYFHTEDDSVTHVIRIVPMKRIDAIDPISRQDNQKLYRWNNGKRNELISRNNNKGENRRVEFLLPGFYFISDKINATGELLYFVTKNFQSGYVKYHKHLYGKTVEFKQRKNKGEIYRITIEKDILKEESARHYDHSDVIHSAYTMHNNDIFPKILQLYAKEGDAIADVTFGNGFFWDKIDTSIYDFYPSDLNTDGIDSRQLQHEDESLDCLVFDPPFVIPGRGFHDRSIYEYRYKLNKSWRNGAPIPDSQHGDAIMELYREQMIETKRVLVNKGIYIIKTQDTVAHNGKFLLFHIWIVNELVKQGFYVEDIFVAVRKIPPQVNFIGHQKHSRKNHSYFIVARKSNKRNSS